MRTIKWIIAGTILVILLGMLVTPLLVEAPRPIGPSTLLTAIRRHQAGLQTYVSDHDDRFPSVDQWQTVLRDPSTVPSLAGEVPKSLKWRDGTDLSPAMNGLMDRRKAVTDSSETVALFLTLGKGTDLWGGPTAVWAMPGSGAKPFGFCDGHAKIVRPEALASLLWHPGP